jgi:hypothetical protein
VSDRSKFSNLEHITENPSAGPSARLLPSERAVPSAKVSVRTGRERDRGASEFQRDDLLGGEAEDADRARLADDLSANYDTRDL